MDTEKALDFLKQHQLMPDDLELTETQIDTYENVRKFFHGRIARRKPTIRLK